MYKLFIAGDSRVGKVGHFVFIKEYDSYKKAEQAMHSFKHGEFYRYRRWEILNTETKEISIY